MCYFIVCLTAYLLGIALVYRVHSLFTFLFIAMISHHSVMDGEGEQCSKEMPAFELLSVGGHSCQSLA